MASVPEAMFTTHPDLTDLASRDCGYFEKAVAFIQDFDLTNYPGAAEQHADIYAANLESGAYRQRAERRARLGGHLPTDPKPRTTCPACAKDVAQRRDGNPVAHRHEGAVCRG